MDNNNCCWLVLWLIGYAFVSLYFVLIETTFFFLSYFDLYNFVKVVILFMKINCGLFFHKYINGLNYDVLYY